MTTSQHNAKDVPGALKRLGLYKYSDDKYIPFAIARYNNPADGAGAAVDRKLDGVVVREEGDYIVVTPNYQKNHGPVGDDNNGCIDENESIVGSSVVEYINDVTAIDTYQPRRIPVRTKCGIDPTQCNCVR
jgi:hypothetical protein